MSSDRAESEPPAVAAFDDCLRSVPRLVGRVAKKASRKRVHDLRVALRAARSLLSALCEAAPSPPRACRKLRRGAKKLFRSLADARSAHVAAECAAEVLPARDPARRALLSVLAEKSADAEARAVEAASRFDRAKWKKRSRKLSPVLQAALGAK